MSNNSNLDIAIKGSQQTSSNFEFNKNLNVEFLNRTYLNNLTFCEQMFSIFLSNIEEDMNILSKGINNIDFDIMADIAHKIKNNFRWVGLTQLSQMMHDIQKKADVKNQDAISIHQEFITSFNQKYSLIKKEHSRLKAYLID